MPFPKENITDCNALSRGTYLQIILFIFVLDYIRKSKSGRRN
jgi:hypothetical protein